MIWSKKNELIKSTIMNRSLLVKSLFVLSIVMSLMLSGFQVSAQISHGGKPWTFSTEKGIQNSFINVEYDEVTLKAPNVEPLLAEDEANAVKDKPPRVGVSIDVDFDMETSGVWTDLPMGARLWTMKITVPGAKALTLGFDNFELAEGGKLFFYNENRRQVLGSFTSENNLENKSFAIEPVQGENVYIEYYEPGFMKSAGKTMFHIYNVGYFYRDLVDLKSYKDDMAKTVKASESCEVDVNCSPVGDNWQDEKRGVAQITFLSGGSWYLCSGSLVNNTASDGTPYFLTAFHCGEDETTTNEYNQWVFKFLYEASAAQASGHGTTLNSEPATKSITGCSLKALGSITGGSDMQLLLLNQTPTSQYQPYYNGWNRGTTAPSNGVGIHHPSGDIKKISTYSTSTTGTYNSAASSAHWRLQWTANANGHGVTEGGSSGSPLFDSNGYIVGTLTGGSAYCTAINGYDYYGKMSYHWSSNGNTNNKQLKPWLDPNNSNPTVCPAYDPFATQPPEVDFAASSTTILEGSSVDFYNYTSNNPVSYSWTFQGATPSSSTAMEPTGITYNTAGTYDVSLSATNPNGTRTETKNDYINVVSASSSFCDTLVQFGGSLTNYIFGSSTSVTGYVGGTNNYNMTSFAEKFTGTSPYNRITGFRFIPSVAKRGTNCNVTFKLWDISGDVPNQVLASKSISLASVVTAMNNDGYIDISFDNPIEIPATGLAIGFDRPGTPASGDTLATYTNDETDEGIMNTAYVYYEDGWYLYTQLLDMPSIQFPMLPFVCYDGSAAPTANFTSDVRQIAVGESVTFEDISSGNVTSRTWTFEGGNISTSTLANPVVTYNTAGSYQVSLTVSNANGQDTKTVAGYVEVYDPNARNAFSLDFEACGNFQVDEFDPWTTYDGDGKTTYGIEGVTFENSGYTGSFIAYNASATEPASGASWTPHGGSRCGACMAATTPPNNDWLISAPISLGNNSSITFWAKSVNDQYGLERFNVLLSTTNNNTASFTTKLSGNTYVQAPTTWTQYTYDLSAYDGRNVYIAIQCVSNDAFAFLIDDILISSEYSAPEADFSADYTSVEVGGTVNFSDNSTMMPTSWAWTFEGGTPSTSTVQNPSVVYNATGTYSVSLTATNAQGTDTETKTGYITVTPQSEVIVEWNFPTNSADATADAGIAANLSKTISVGGGVGTLSYSTDGATTKCARAQTWKNGSGTKYFAVNFTTANYNNIKVWSKQNGSANNSPRDFKLQYSLNNSTWTDVPNTNITVARNWTTGVLDGVLLPEACNNQATVYLRWIMRSNTGISGTMTNTAYAYIDDIVVKGILMTIPPEAEFTADATTICAGQTITFTDQTANTPTSWSWNFGDGGTSTQQNPTHTYATAGTYTVTLVATNEFGSDTETKISYITVNANPTVTASNGGAYCAGETAQLSAQVTGATSYAWSGPANFTANTQNPSITNATTNNAGTYTITVTGNGCTATASTSVVVNANPTLTASNGGPYCEGANISLTANGNGGTVYAWSGPNGFTSNVRNAAISNASEDNAGTYTVVLTNPTTGCSASATTLVAVNPNPTLNASNTGAYCAGETITLNANGSGGTVYFWNGPNGYTSSLANNTITNATTANAGTYNVTLTNQTTGCSAASSTVVVINANPTVTASNSGAYCAGETIRLTATATGATSYSWSGPNGYASAQQNPTITNATTNNGGTYNVVVSNASGCSASASTVVAVNANPIANASNGGAYCAGQTISLQTTATGSFAWSGPNGFTSTSQNPTIANSTTANAGTYTLVVTNANSCTAQATTNVVVNAVPTVTASNTGAYCAGETISLRANGTGITSYSWSGPNGFSSTNQNPTIANATVANAGNYSLTVSNANGCQAESSTTVVVNANPTVTASNGGAYCAGQTIALTANASGNASYSWSGPNGFTSTIQNPTIANAANNNAGTYTVVATDANGCQAETSTAVVVNANPTIELGANRTVCSGATVTLDAGAGYTYSWSNNATTQTITVGEGSYSVTVYNANECSATDNVSVSYYPQTTLSMSSTPESGHSRNDGTAIVTANGTAPYSYSWSNNATTAQLTGLTGGNYSVTVTDGNGCTSSAMVSVATTNTPPVADFSANNQTVCLGSEIAFADLSTNTPTTWAWNFGDGTTSNVQNPTHTYANAGTYTVSLVVTNIDGSDTKQKTNYITVNANPTATASNTGAYCVGETIALSVATDNGTTYQWSGPMGFSSALQNPTRDNSSVNYSGTYSVTVTNANSCTASASTEVVVNANPTASITNNTGVATITCDVTSISLTANGGATYAWSNGANTADCTVSSEGVYTVTVTNEASCSAEASIAIEADTNVPTVSISGDVAYCVGGDIALAAVSANASSYVWNGPDGFVSTSASISVLNASGDNAGVYEVTVTSANGCEATEQVTVAVNALPMVDVANDGPVCVGGNVALSAVSSETLTYSWSGPDGFASNVASPEISNVTIDNSGIYTLLVVNAATGCANTFSTEVVVNAVPVVTLGDDVTVCANVDAILNATAGFISYEWNGVAGSQTFTTSEAGVYTVVVTDNNGCTASDQVVVSHYELPVLTMSSTPESGTGRTDGTATVEIDGGLSPYSILWNTSATTEQITGLTNGQYSVVVTDANGCAVDGSVDVSTLNTPPVANFTADVVEGCAPLAVNFTDNSTNFPQTWSWDFNGVSSAEQNPTFVFEEAGEYTVSLTVTNLDGSDTQTMTINVYANPTLDLGEDLEACEGATLTIAAGDFAAYEWSNSSTESSIAVAEAGVYSLTVTDEHGCVASDEIAVTFNPVPVVALGDDTEMCSNAEMELSAGAEFASYLWNTGEATSSIVITEAGEYALTVTNEFGCEASDAIVVTSIAAPVITLADTITACVNELVEITLDTEDAVVWLGSVEGNTYSQTYPYAGEYGVWVTVSNDACEASDTIVVVVENCTSIDEVETAMTIELYPNPTRDFATFTVAGYDGQMSYSIVDVSGKEMSFETVYVAGETLQTIDVSRLAPGMYMLRVMTDNGVQNLKFTKQQ